MTAFAPTTITTSRTSYSFYVPATSEELIVATAADAEALTVRGRKGPSFARSALGAGWDRPLLFDCACYESRSSYADPQRWFDDQTAAGADRLLTPGSWIPWSKDERAEMLEAVEREWKASLMAPGSTLVLAVDSRWLGRRLRELEAALKDVGEPVALVMAHRADPLSDTGVFDGLLGLLRRVPRITILRSDHGAIGAVAFGAVHGSIGLKPMYRHFVPPGAGGGGKQQDRSPRLFVWDLMDWFTGDTIAGWGASAIRLSCNFSCCDGRTISRFFDPRHEEEAAQHNRTSLRTLAEHVLDADENDRRREFAKLCAEAVDCYGPMGKLSDLIEPRTQLVQWAQWA